MTVVQNKCKALLTENVGGRRQRRYFNNHNVNYCFMMKLNSQIKKVIKSEEQVSGWKCTSS